MRKFLTSTVVLNGDAVVIVFRDGEASANNKLFGYYTYAANRRGAELSMNRYFDSIEEADATAIKELKELGY